MNIGVLALQGAVSEHISCLKGAMEKLGIAENISLVREKEELGGLDGLIIPGGESTTHSLLLEKEGMVEGLGKIPKIFGTCAGAILISREIIGQANGQKSLGLIDMAISRNGYGRQLDSFQSPIESSLGKLDGVFIRAPVIERVGEKVEVLAEHRGKPVAVQQGKHVATTFHPELSGSTAFHEHFLRIDR
ncbi:pyridoxal 5'-phosphate synthase glutaminase subunit PdxT [Candidatus Micrarchaeota archaeon]|nr:pyridoxal 5'-phosphate synthase glutaminase subunit PdxT [Candidatus Micrarchaeota archaeon]MBD3417742.1 pyridoxal 5'-phosphate synthase glutaminase subunit PdxT [Candidatus Micrarchaeota archaeon]